jgi:hypothetical protein
MKQGGETAKKDGWNAEIVALFHHALMKIPQRGRRARRAPAGTSPYTSLQMRPHRQIPNLPSK